MARLKTLGKQGVERTRGTAKEGNLGGLDKEGTGQNTPQPLSIVFNVRPKDEAGQVGMTLVWFHPSRASVAEMHLSAYLFAPKTRN